MAIIAGISYIASLFWLGASLCNSEHPYLEYILPCVIASAVWFGYFIHRRLYEHNA